MALGGLARRQAQLDLNPEVSATTGPLVKPRQMQVRVHTSDEDSARCETTRSPMTVDQVKSWCTHPDTQVVITEVIDLTEHLHTSDEDSARCETTRSPMTVDQVKSWCT